MTGVIWLVQVIHYPLFKYVGEHTFKDYHKGHLQKTSLVIAIPMILELATALYLLIRYDVYRNSHAFIFASSVLIIIWLITFLISVPKHEIISKGYNESAIAALVKTNWLRTIAWTIRAVVLFFLL
jgi:hypothetical protein